MPRKSDDPIVFVTTPHTDPWAGSEELWAGAALDLVSGGYSVVASINHFSPLHPRHAELRERGVELWQRPRWYSWTEHPVRRLLSRARGPLIHEVKRLLAARPPTLVVFSEGNALPPLELLELCAARDAPFVTITQANKEAVWHPDDSAARYRAALAVARRCFFVSEGNRLLCEKQLAGRLGNAEIVRNPVSVPFDIVLPWPARGEGGEIRFACVGRLYPPAKGQDILFETLATDRWKGRPWRLYVYGAGAMRQGLERLAAMFGISDRVVFGGYAAVENIWAENHVLVMPSRFEGLPIAMVEAMLCGRPVIATDIAGHREIIDDGVTGFLADAPTAHSFAIALERFWERRLDAEQIGKAAAGRIRQLIPADPVRVFSDRLVGLIELVSRSAPAINARAARAICDASPPG
jgi:glycosyltransferase involved in cell wall biosynthesis